MSHSENHDFKPEYIIIGGGTTGLVVAGRLAEQGALVCILEAGKHIVSDDRIEIPGFFGRSLGDPHLDWLHSTEPQLSVNNRVIPLPRGKAVGGTSVINSMTWGRGSRTEYDSISWLSGNEPEWSWKDMLRYFKKSETMLPAESPTWAQAHGATVVPEYHGNNGPLVRGFVSWLGDTHIPFFKTMNNFGVSTNPDSCSGFNLGVFTLATSIDPRTSKRTSSSSAYYETNAQRSNLKLITGAYVRRIVLRALTGTTLLLAEAVEFEKEGKLHRLPLTREVILSAGAYETPKLLELSGIGDPERLEGICVKPMIDLKGVGENLQDHLLVPSSFELKSGVETGDLLSDPEYAARELALYREDARGQYTSIHSAFSLLAGKSIISEHETRHILSVADRDFSSSRISPNLLEGRKKLQELQRQWFQDEGQGLLEFMHVPQFLTNLASSAKGATPYLSILSVLMHPFSRGHAHARSNQHLDKPAIDPGYLTNEADLLTLIKGLKFVRKLVCETRPLKSYVVAPTDPKPDELSDKDLEQYVKSNLETAHHPIGTASMLPREEGGVVGSDLLVHGTRNLRVADASIIPIHLSAHPQATLYAIGEKAATLILQARRAETSKL